MLTLKNRFYTLMLDEAAGCLSALEKDGKNLLADRQAPLFRMRCRDAAGEPVLFSAADPHELRVERLENRAVLTFAGLAGTDETVTVTVSCDDTPFSRWSASASGSLQLEWLESPCVTVPDTFADKGGNSKILWPFNEGCLTGDISKHECVEPEYPSHGDHTMCPGMIFAPFLAVMSDNGGLYFAAHDREQNTRNVDYFRTENGVQLKLRVYPGIEGGNYTGAEDTLLGVFDGDWYAAAEIYRSWFEENKPERLYRISENPNLPEWYSDSPIVLTYCVRGHHDTDLMEPNKLFPYINALPFVEEMSERLHSRVLVILMHWEGTAPWAPPYVWPPYGGEDALREFIDALHERGHLLGVYCSGYGWTQHSNVAEFSMEKKFADEHLEKYMCVSPTGTLPHSHICTAQRCGYDLCPSQEFNRATLENEVRQMAAAKIDYAQLLDQNHGGTPYFCYSKEHGHPPVPGTWESRMSIEIMQRLRAACGDHKMLMGCESAAAEVLIPELLLSDNRYELCYMSGIAVPLYSYIYHEYLNNFMGNQVCGASIFDPGKSPDNMLYRLAYSFAAGDFMTLVVNDEGKVQFAWGQNDFSYMPDSDAIYTLAGNLNVWRRCFAKKYLHDGKMLRPWDYTADADVSVWLDHAVELVVPAVMAARYQAADGTVGQIMINFSREPVTCTLDGTGKTLYTAPDAAGIPAGTAVTVPSLTAVLITEE